MVIGFFRGGVVQAGFPYCSQVIKEVTKHDWIWILSSPRKNSEVAAQLCVKYGRMKSFEPAQGRIGGLGIFMAIPMNVTSNSWFLPHMFKTILVDSWCQSYVRLWFMAEIICHDRINGKISMVSSQKNMAADLPLRDNVHFHYLWRGECCRNWTRTNRISKSN